MSSFTSSKKHVSPFFPNSGLLHILSLIAVYLGSALCSLSLAFLKLRQKLSTGGPEWCQISGQTVKPPTNRKEENHSQTPRAR